MLMGSLTESRRRRRGLFLYRLDIDQGLALLDQLAVLDGISTTRPAASAGTSL